MVFLCLWQLCSLLCRPPQRSLSDRDIKKGVSNGLLFPGNLDPSSLTPGGPVVLLVWGFKRRRDNLLAWRELFANLYELKSCIRFWEEYNHFERIYRVFRFDRFLSNFAKHSGNNDKRKCVGKFWYLKFCLVTSIYATPRIFLATPTSDTVHLRDTTHIFSYSNFRYRYLDNPSEYRKSLTHCCWLMPCEWDCAAILLVLWHSIPDKFNRRTWHRLLTLP